MSRVLIALICVLWASSAMAQSTNYTPVPLPGLQTAPQAGTTMSPSAAAKIAKDAIKDDPLATSVTPLARPPVPSPRWGHGTRYLGLGPKIE